MERLKVYDFKKDDLKTLLWHRIARVSNVKKIVVIKDGKIVGYAWVSYTNANEAGRITNLEATPELVSKGIEVELVKTGVNYIRSSGAKTILLTTPLEGQTEIQTLMTIGFEKSYVMEGMLLEL